LSDLDMELMKAGLHITNFTISNVNYPEEVQQRINRNAAMHMVGDIDRYTRLSMADAMQKGGDSAMGSSMGAAAGMAAGFQMANEMFSNKGASNAQPAPAPAGDKKFCMHCGTQLPIEAKFCFSCGKQL
jgi:membrane protease subunit (stomatin/prohibitin family)